MRNAITIGLVTLGVVTGFIWASATVKPEIQTVEVPGPTQVVTNTVEVPGPTQYVEVTPEDCVNAIEGLVSLLDTENDALIIATQLVAGDITEAEAIEAFDLISFQDEETINAVFEAATRCTAGTGPTA